MSDGERRAGGTAGKWNSRYAFSGDTVPPPAEVLSRNAKWLPERARASEPPGAGALGGATRAGAEGEGDALPGAATRGDGEALDLACGRAGNGEWLAARGYRVTAWDISAKVVEAIGARPASGIARAEVRDVLADPPAPETFDVIVVARFLERALCPAIARALRPRGVLFYQTFTHGLANPRYLLGPNELLELFPSLVVLSYREPAPGADGRAEAMLVARQK